MSAYPRDPKGRFLPRVRDPEPDQSYMVEPDPDSRHLFLSWLWLGGSLLLAKVLYGMPLAIDALVIIVSGFAVFFNLAIWCGKRWPKTTIFVLWFISGLFGGGRYRRW